MWCILLCTAGAVFAQESDSAEVAEWDITALGKLNASQATYRAWTEGGISSLASTAQVSLDMKRQSNEWHQAYEMRSSFGVIKQDTLNVRKAEDLIRIKGQISYSGDGRFRVISPTVAFGIRTQFAPGFSYDKNPLNNGWPLPVKVSDFFSPATFTQSLGFSYRTSWGFDQRLGVAAKEMVVLIDYLRPLYGLTPDQAIRYQLGIESHTQLDYEVVRNVRYKSSIGLFAAFNQENLPDMLWENTIVMKVNSWLSTDIEVVMLYDRDISKSLQLKEVFSIGLSIVFI